MIDAIPVKRGSAWMKLRPLHALVGVLSIALAAAIVYPLATLVLSVFIEDGHFSLKALSDAAAEPLLLRTIGSTILYVGSSACLALLFGAVLAWLVERTDVGLTWATGIIPLMPLLVPPLAGTIGWVFLFSPRVGYVNQLARGAIRSTERMGPFNVFTFAGMVLITVVYLIPYVYLSVSAGLRNLDGALDEASCVFGAGKLRTMLRISLPAIRPAMVTAAVLALMSGLAMFSVPAILGPTAHVEILSVLIFRVVAGQSPPRFDEAIALSVLMLIMLQPLILFQRSIGNPLRYQTLGGRSSRGGRVPLGPWRWAGRLAILAYLVPAVLPIIGLILVAIQRFWGENINWARLSLSSFGYVLGQSAQMASALKNSVILAAVGAALSMVIAAFISYQATQRRGPLSRLVESIAALPASVPHIVMGLALLIAFSQAPLNLAGSSLLLLLAYIVIFMPQATQSARFAFVQIGRELPEASRVAGASELMTFVKVLLPLALPSLVSGGLILAVLMLSEVNASVLLVSADNPVVGPTLYNLWDGGTTFPPLAALAIIIVIANTLVAIAARRLGTIFRATR